MSRLDAWYVMPNHVHAVIVIEEANIEAARQDIVETPRRGVSTKADPIRLTFHLFTRNIPLTICKGRF
jgi:hypothetical protein